MLQWVCWVSGCLWISGLLGPWVSQSLSFSGSLGLSRALWVSLGPSGPLSLAVSRSLGLGDDGGLDRRGPGRSRRGKSQSGADLGPTGGCSLGRFSRRHPISNNQAKRKASRIMIDLRLFNSRDTMKL